jgi:hypothetical protein
MGVPTNAQRDFTDVINYEIVLVLATHFAE